MPYTANRNFPLNEAYKFASQVGGELEEVVEAIHQKESIPPSLEDPNYGGTSQARRSLVYLALQQNGLWDRFVQEFWPTAESPSGREIVEELLDDYIRNGKLRWNQNLLAEPIRRLL